MLAAAGEFRYLETFSLLDRNKESERGSDGIMTPILPRWRRLAHLTLAATLFLLGTVRIQAGSPAWGTVPRPSGGFGPNELFDVAVLAPNDIWAIGELTSCHYDGTTWTPISIPSSGGVDRPDDVSAVSTSDVWAVGSSVFCDGFGCWSQS